MQSTRKSVQSRRVENMHMHMHMHMHMNMRMQRTFPRHLQKLMGFAEMCQIFGRYNCTMLFFQTTAQLHCKKRPDRVPRSSIHLRLRQTCSFPLQCRHPSVSSLLLELTVVLYSFSDGL